MRQNVNNNSYEGMDPEKYTQTMRIKRELKEDGKNNVNYEQNIENKPFISSNENISYNQEEIESPLLEGC